MPIHSSILAWKILGTEEPGKLQSMGDKESDTTEVTQHLAHNESKKEKESKTMS